MEEERIGSLPDVQMKDVRVQVLDVPGWEIASIKALNADRPLKQAPAGPFLGDLTTPFSVGSINVLFRLALVKEN